MTKFDAKCKTYIFWFRWERRNIYNIKYDSRNEVSNLSIRRWRLILFLFVDASYLIINSTERQFDDVCDYNVSTKSKLWRKISNKQDLISRILSIFDRFSNESLNVICSSLCIDFDAESQTSILSIDDFIEERRKRKEDYTCWIYEYISWFSSTNTSRKEEKSFARFSRSFLFFSYSSILMTWLTCMILIIDVFLLISYDDVSCWTDFISTRILIRCARNDDVEVFIQFLSTIWSIIIFEEHWTQIHRRVCLYEVDSIIFFTETESSSFENDDFTHEKYEIKKKSKRFARHLLMNLLKKERILKWFII